MAFFFSFYLYTYPIYSIKSKKYLVPKTTFLYSWLGAGRQWLSARTLGFSCWCTQLAIIVPRINLIGYDAATVQSLVCTLTHPGKVTSTFGAQVFSFVRWEKWGHWPIYPQIALWFSFFCLFFVHAFLFAPFFLLLISSSFPFPFPHIFPALWPASLSKFFSCKHQIATKFQPAYKTKAIYSSWNKFHEVKGSITSEMAWSGHSVSLKLSLGPFPLALPLS